MSNNYRRKLYRRKLEHYTLFKGVTILRMSRCNNKRDCEVLKNEINAAIREMRWRGEIVRVWCEEYPELWIILQNK